MIPEDLPCFKLIVRRRGDLVLAAATLLKTGDLGRYVLEMIEPTLMPGIKVFPRPCSPFLPSYFFVLYRAVWSHSIVPSGLHASHTGPSRKDDGSAEWWQPPVPTSISRNAQSSLLSQLLTFASKTPEVAPSGSIAIMNYTCWPIQTG